MQPSSIETVVTANLLGALRDVAIHKLWVCLMLLLVFVLNRSTCLHTFFAYLKSCLAVLETLFEIHQYAVLGKSQCNLWYLLITGKRSFTGALFQL